MAAFNARATTEGNNSVLRHVTEIEEKLHQIRQALAQQPDTGTGVAPTAGPSRAYEDHTVKAGDNTWGVKIKFGSAEPSGIPIRAKHEQEEKTILKKKLETAIMPLPVIANETLRGQLESGPLVIEIANFLASDLFNPRCSNVPKKINDCGLPETVKAGAREVISWSDLFHLGYQILFSYQITSELKILVSLVMNNTVVVALAPSELPLTNNAITFDVTGEDDDWNDIESLEVKQRLCNSGRGEGIRRTRSLTSSLQIGIVNDARENPLPGGVCKVPACKRQRINETGNSLNVQGDVKYLVKRVYRTRQCAMKSTGGIPREMQPPISPLVEMTVNEILEKKLELFYGYVLEIENLLDVDLEEPDYYFDAATEDAEWVPLRVRAMARDVVILKAVRSGKNSSGVVLYQISGTDLRLAVAFQLLNSGNVFAAAFVPAVTVDFLLVEYLTSGNFWVTSPDRKYGQAQNGDLVIEVRNIQARVTMTNDFKARMKIQIKTI